MFIYIDESGSFSVPTKPKLSISGAGALIVPESAHDALRTAFVAASASWPKENGEVKGKLLQEPHIAAAVRLFAHHGALFECVAIDLGLHRARELEQHRDSQADGLTANLTPRHQPTLVAEAHEIAARLRRLATPSYVQMTALTGLVERVLATKILYFVQRAPAEIGNFRWIIDAKASHRSEYERLWELLVLPQLEARSFRSPLLQLRGADYSAFARFEHDAAEPPEHLRQLLPNWKPGDTIYTTDIRKIMEEHRSFADSRDELGLQMADVMTNAATRALKGNLGLDGWRDFGRVMLRQPDGKEIIGLIRLHPDDRRWPRQPPYHAVLAHLRSTASRVLLP